MAKVSLIGAARAELSERLASLGYHETSAANVLVHRWRRALGGPRHVDFFLQRRHQPWLVAWNGNAFSAGFAVEPRPHSFSNTFDGHVWFLLTEDERSLMRRLHDAIIANLPKPTVADGLLTTTEIDGVLDEHRRLAQPWVATQEVMFTYRTNDDIRRWMSFLRDLLPQLEERVLSRCLADG